MQSASAELSGSAWKGNTAKRFSQNDGGIRMDRMMTHIWPSTNSRRDTEPTISEPDRACISNAMTSYLTIAKSRTSSDSTTAVISV